MNDYKKSSSKFKLHLFVIIEIRPYDLFHSNIFLYII